MDVVVRADAAGVGIVMIPAFVVACKTGFSPTVALSDQAPALTARSVSIGNCSLSAVPADITLLVREVSHV